MSRETIPVALMEISAQLLGAILLKTAMVAQTVTMMAGPTPINGANGDLFGPQQMVVTHFGKTPLNGRITILMAMVTTGPTLNGTIHTKRWALANL